MLNGQPTGCAQYSVKRVAASAAFCRSCSRHCTFLIDFSAAGRRRPRRCYEGPQAAAEHSAAYTGAVAVLNDANQSVVHLLKTVPGGNAEAGLAAADAFWKRLCNEASSVPEVVRQLHEPLERPSGAAKYDVVVLGGTLGVFLACALQLRGRKVAIVERNELVGREQEWNIGRADMQAFVAEGVLTAAEVDEVIVSEFNPVRVAFEGVAEIVTRDVLNCGVSPRRIVQLLKSRFLDSGGTLLEGASFEAARVHPDGVEIDVTQRGEAARRQGAGGAGGEGNEQMQASTSGRAAEGQATVCLRCDVVVDALGGFSPIARQARRGRKPDSVVLMVGSCAEGLPEVEAADLLYSFTPLNRQRKLQYFWETFPASDGVTTYMFCYADPTPGRATLRDLYEDYVTLLPQYRGCRSLEGVTLRRAMFGVVPNWHDSPTPPLAPRLLHVGDSAGNRSALSFAGFGAMARHLTRLRRGLEDALDLGLTDAASLRLLQPYSPAISMTAAMQFSMGTRHGQRLDDFDDDIINDYIGSSFRDMKRFGPEVYRPFMQDYLQWSSLSKIVGRQLVTQPGKLARMTLFMRSPAAGRMFAANFAMLLAYDLLLRAARLAAPAHERFLPPRLLYRWRRQVEAFEFGSANDYKESAYDRESASEGGVAAGGEA